MPGGAWGWRSPFQDGSLMGLAKFTLSVGWELGCGCWPGASISLLVGVSVELLGLPYGMVSRFQEGGSRNCYFS